MAVRTIREILENPKIRDQIRDQTLTFAVLSQTMGVVTCGKEMKLVRSPGSYFKKYYGGIPSEQKEFYETYISTTSSPQKISSWLSQTHANSKWP
jgi:hypothetical protein